VKTYGVLLAFAFLLGLPMFMLPMFMLLMLPMFVFRGMLAFALFAFAVPVLAVDGVEVMFALPAVFELSAVAQPAQRTVAVSKSTKPMVRRIEVPLVCIRYNGNQMSNYANKVKVAIRFEADWGRGSLKSDMLFSKLRFQQVQRIGTARDCC
jgi:hypothetical protein